MRPRYIMAGVSPIFAALAFVLYTGRAVPTFAQLAAGNESTNIVVTSETITELAWKRGVVMKSGATGEIFNDDGAVGSAAAESASGEAAESAAEISDAANAAMTNALAVLDVAKGSAATNAIGIALIVPPETSRTNLTVYVVKTESDGAVDTQWVWFNRRIDLPPNRFVVYETYDRAATNKCEWTDWTNAVTITHNGRTWEGCHVCTVIRPDWAAGLPCLDIPNEKLGGPSGFDFGDLLLTSGGEPLFTGFVTNGLTGEVLYFDNGFNKGTPPEGETP